MGITIDHQELTWPEKLVKDTVAWMQGFVYRPASAVAGFFKDVKDFTILFEENKAVKYSLHQYSQVVSELNQLKEENKRLKEMLDYKENNGLYTLQVSKVIARSPDRWNNMLVIDKGAKDGIKKDMAVITTQGLIGKIYSVSSFSSNVQLITDTDRSSFIFALIQSDPITYGVVEGYDKINNELSVTKISLEAHIKPGQLVTTSNLGEVFPTGLVIGAIIRIEEEENGGLTKTVYITPAADLYHIDEVFVVMKANNQSTSEKEEDSE